MSRCRAPLLAAVALAACGPPCARGGGKCTEDPPDRPAVDEPLYQVVLATQAVHCTPYQGWEELDTPAGEVVTGLEVCAEFTDACWCETSDTSRLGTAAITPDPGAGTGCLSWRLVSSSFWLYPTGTVCPARDGWSLEIEAHPETGCAIALVPQLEWSELVRMEVVCEWTSDDGTVHVTDRLLFQIRT